MFIDKPTRVTSDSATCIDHVYSNLLASDLYSHVLLSDVSDHFATLTKISGLGKSHEYDVIYRRKTNLSEQEWKKFNEELHATLSDKQLLTQNLSANFVAECITKSYQASNTCP